MPFGHHGRINLVIPSYSVLAQWTCALRLALRRPGSIGMWPHRAWTMAELGFCWNPTLIDTSR